MLRTAALLLLAATVHAQALEVVGGYDTGAGEGAEIISIQASTQRAVVLVKNLRVDLLDLSRPARPKRVARHDLKLAKGETITSVAFHPKRDMYIAAVRAARPDQRGRALVVEASSGKITGTALLGFEPDHVTIDPKGILAAVANEAEAYRRKGDGFESKAGSVTILVLVPNGPFSGEISLPPAEGVPGMVTAADGRKLERTVDGETVLIPLDSGDPKHLEPEFVVFDAQLEHIYITLQENNGIAVVEIEAEKVTRYIGLGKTRHPADVDDDGKVAFDTKLTALREPDGIAVTPDGKFLITADEGDTDPKASKTPRSMPAGGGRTVTVIEAATGRIVADTGNALDAAAHAAGVYPDKRSDSKGSEPEGVLVFEHDARVFAAVGLERARSVALLEITKTGIPVVLGVFPLGGKSSAPEGLAVLRHEGVTYVYTANEKSGDVTVFRLRVR